MSYKTKKLDKMLERLGDNYSGVYFGWDEERDKYGWIIQNYQTNNGKFLACNFTEAILYLQEEIIVIEATEKAWEELQEA